MQHILAALQRRGIDPSGLAPGLQQLMTPDAPGAQPGMEDPGQPPMPDKSPISMMGQDPQQQFTDSMQPQQQADGTVTLPVEDQNPQQPGVQIPQSEVEMILQAFTDRLKHRSKMEAQSNQPMM